MGVSNFYGHLFTVDMGGDNTVGVFSVVVGLFCLYVCLFFNSDSHNCAFASAFSLCPAGGVLFLIVTDGLTVIPGV